MVPKPPLLLSELYFCDYQKLEIPNFRNANIIPIPLVLCHNAPESIRTKI